MQQYLGGEYICSGVKLKTLQGGASTICLRCLSTQSGLSPTQLYGGLGENRNQFVLLRLFAISGFFFGARVDLCSVTWLELPHENSVYPHGYSLA